MMATGPSPLASGACSWMCLIMGTTYARVLPEPVLATPIKSLPDNIIGMVCACTGDGLTNRS